MKNRELSPSKKFEKYKDCCLNIHKTASHKIMRLSAKKVSDEFTFPESDGEAATQNRRVPQVPKHNASLNDVFDRPISTEKK